MHRVHLSYTLAPERHTQRELQHPLMALLDAVHNTGSISGAARELGLSYRHVWGELKRWEAELGRDLVLWVKGQSALLSPFGEKLLWAERQAQARLAPQIEALRSELEQAFAVAFDDSAGVLTLCASHDLALPLLRDAVRERHQLHLDIQYTGSVEALAALNQGRCLLAGFHALTHAAQRSPTALAYRPLLQPGKHKLIAFARRRQGLIVAPGNPLGLTRLADVCDAATSPAVRFVSRPMGAGSRIVLSQLLAAEGLSETALPDAGQRSEPSHRAVAETVASGAADVGFGIEAAAQARGLGFVPLAEEDYFLVTLAPHLANPHVRTLLKALASADWRATLAALPGYTPGPSGDVLSLRQVLPWWNYRKPKG